MNFILCRCSDTCEFKYAVRVFKLSVRQQSVRLWRLNHLNLKSSFEQLASGHRVRLEQLQSDPSGHPVDGLALGRGFEVRVSLRRRRLLVP